MRSILVILLLLLPFPTHGEVGDVYPDILRMRLDSVMRDPLLNTSQLGLYVYDLTADSALYGRGADQCMRPASCEKIMTSATALCMLGEDYCYTTNLYITADPEPDGTLTGDVVLQGGFDPLFGADDMRTFVKALSSLGVRAISGHIVTDLSFKDDKMMGWGWCWDDEPTPLTPLLYDGHNTFVAHFKTALSGAGIAFTGSVITGQATLQDQLVAQVNRPMHEVMIPMMKKSVNLYAESLFYQLAAHRSPTGGSREDAAEEVNALITQIGHNPGLYVIADGSGLSLYNYISPHLLVDVLRYIYRKDVLYAHLYRSLPVMGRDGTLSKRCIGTVAQDRVHAKTGTLTGVSSLSGYAMAPNGHTIAFSIINQGLRASADGRRFQDKVCIALTKEL